MDDSVFVIVDDSVAVSFGGSPGTAPTAPSGAVWRGTLVGVDTQTRDRIEGDAVIDIDDFARPDVDIAFTRIADTHGRSRADLRWEDIPVVKGTFQMQDADGTNEGRFYGGDHQKVGGIFDRDQLIGAFGASR